MEASYRKARAETIAEFARAGVEDRDARAFLRYATTLQRLGEIGCSVELPPAWEQANTAKEQQAERLALAMAKRLGVAVEFQGDPRGCPLSVKVGMREITVPGCGLTLRQMDDYGARAAAALRRIAKREGN